MPSFLLLPPRLATEAAQGSRRSAGGVALHEGGGRPLAALRLNQKVRWTSDKLRGRAVISVARTLRTYASQSHERVKSGRAEPARQQIVTHPYGQTALRDAQDDFFVLSACRVRGKTFSVDILR